MERLKIFLGVCRAVEHAHQKGIVHRDIKPSNILVRLCDSVPVPKIIDFGIAKATQQSLTNLTLLTQLEQIMGTPIYMSPEQAEWGGQEIDARSDVYSLGVLLYELLTGRTPINPQDFIDQGLDQVRRAIREDSPKKPSTLLSALPPAEILEVARHRKADPHQLIRELRGDLDAIVMSALEKDRLRRYGSAVALSGDLEKFLSDLPLPGRTPSHRVFGRQMLTRLGGIVLAVLVVGGGVKFLSLRGDGTQPETVRGVLPAGSNPSAEARTGGITTSREGSSLNHQDPIYLGEGSSEMVGFQSPGPVVHAADGVPSIRLNGYSGPASDLKIQALYYCAKTAVSSPRVRNMAEVVEVDLWRPNDSRLAERVRDSRQEAGDVGQSVAPVRPLPHGVYCIYSGQLQSASPPSFAATFIYGGIPRISAKDANVEKVEKELRLTLPLQNSGEGDFKDGFVVITLQRINGSGRPTFQQRWQMALPKVAAGGTAQFETSILSDAFQAGSYYFYGHIHYQGMKGDTDKIQDFKSDPFSL